MEQYNFYTARDFALDEDFQQWVLRPDVKSNYRWENWLRQHPEKRSVIEDAAALVRSVRFRDYRLTEEQKEQLWDAVWDTMPGQEAAPAATADEASAQAPWWKGSWKYAAALVIGLLIAGGWFLHRQQRFRPVNLSVSTTLGEVKRLRLPDSSEVVLNAGSTLRYAATSRQLREVWLEGEAYFHVKHTATHQRFLVHTGRRLSVEVLGTQFNVNSFGSRIAVVLQRGSIKLNIREELNGNETQLYLKPGEMLRYNKEDGAYSKTATDAGRAVAWTQRRLSMDNYTLADAAAFMQQVFGKEVVVHDPQLLQYKVSGSMPIIYHPDTMLMQLGKAFGVRFQEEEGRITIKKARGPKAQP